MIELSDVQVSFGERQVLRGVDATLDKGEILGLIGPPESPLLIFWSSFFFLEAIMIVRYMIVLIILAISVAPVQADPKNGLKETAKKSWELENKREKGA